MPNRIWLTTLILAWILSPIKCQHSTTTKPIDSGATVKDTKPADNVQNKSSHYAEFIRYDVDLEPITHLEMLNDPLEIDNRYRRDPQYSSAFDRGYEEFLRNYYRDNNDREQYKVKESAESESAEDDDTNDSGSDESASENEDDGESDENSAESEESTKKSFKKKPKNHNNNNSNNGKNRNKNNRHSGGKSGGKSSDDDYDRVRNESNKKKSKQCKIVKRGNMSCRVCHDPKNDEKSESCSFNSEPKEKKYAYSKDEKFNSNDGDRERESLEENASDDEYSDEEGEEDERIIPITTTGRPPINPPVQYRPRQNYPPPRQYPRQNFPRQQVLALSNFGPQVFPPLASLFGGRRPAPTRIQLANLPKNVALIRYRSSPSDQPFNQQHIRVVTYPQQQQQQYPNQQFPNQQPPQFINQGQQPPQQFSSQIPPNLQPNAQFYRHPYPSFEMRPPRDINGAHSESLLSNVTKEHEYEYLPGYITDDSNQEFSEFMKRDWSKCRKSIEDNQVCFECYASGSRHKECMYASKIKPDNFYKSYSKSNTYNTKRRPYTFESPVPPPFQQQQYDYRDANLQQPPWAMAHSVVHTIDAYNGGESNKDAENSIKSSDDSNNDSNDNNAQTSVRHKNHNNKNNSAQHKQNKKLQQQPQTEPPQHSNSYSDVIYGTSRPGAEPLALFFKTDHTLLGGNSNTNNNNNQHQNSYSDSKAI